MTCRSSRELILDLARGAAVPPAARRVVEEHMAGCPACAADFDRQKELTAGLQALASDAQHWSAPPAMENRLLAALAARAANPASADVLRGTWRKPALAAAAVLMLGVWGLSRPLLPPSPSGLRHDFGTQATHLRPSDSGGPQVRDPAIRDPTFALRAPAGRPAIPRSPDPRSHLRPSGYGGQARDPRVRDPRSGSEVAAVEFIRIPSAIGLPEMESGTVLRMELPLTSLPEYGLDIAPDAMRTSVEADVLVGQDGQPRAIRLVGIPEPAAQDSRSRR